LCQTACETDPNCMAYTYVKPAIGPGRLAGKPSKAAWCWLKSGVPSSVASECCVSGVLVSMTMAPTLVAVRTGEKFSLDVRAQSPTGISLQLSAEAATWSSSNPTVATVDGSGMITGVATGYSMITATYLGEKASADVDVDQPFLFASLSAGYQDICGIT